MLNSHKFNLRYDGVKVERWEFMWVYLSLLGEEDLRRNRDKFEIGPDGGRS